MARNNPKDPMYFAPGAPVVPKEPESWKNLSYPMIVHGVMLDAMNVILEKGCAEGLKKLRADAEELRYPLKLFLDMPLHKPGHPFHGKTISDIAGEQKCAEYLQEGGAWKRKSRKAARKSRKAARKSRKAARKSRKA